MLGKVKEIRGIYFSKHVFYTFVPVKTKMIVESWYLIPLIFLIAYLYSSVGHGGASGYLALMGVSGMAVAVMRPSALIINLFVAGIAFYQYHRAGHFRKKIFLPLGISSVPMAFLGAQYSLDDNWYKRILAVCLLFATLRVLGIFNEKKSEHPKEMPLWAAVFTGASLGLVSGMIGIGGGILLSPVLLLFRWANMKETAAISALFILVNSLSGLIGLYTKGVILTPSLLIWIFPAIAGGLAGSYWGSKTAANEVLKKVLAVVLVLASVKLFID